MDAEDFTLERLGIDLWLLTFYDGEGCAVKKVYLDRKQMLEVVAEIQRQVEEGVN